MSIIIVAGPTAAGKSTFIQQYFPNRTVIDLYDFQKQFHGQIYGHDSVLQSYNECRDALVEAIQRGESVVLEHTLLKRKRRQMYIEAIQQVTNEDIEIYFLMPSDEELLRRLQKRHIGGDMDIVRSMKEMAELPTLDEGFSTIYIITDSDASI